MRAADVYVLPTERESFGLTLVEAMAAGAAIVTTDAAPMRGEVVAEGGAEFVPPGDVDALAAAMLRLLTDPERRRTLGAAGRARAAAEFSPEAAARRHAEFYNARLRAIGRSPLRPGRVAGEPPQ
jgi:glycosyltransferase involved in cell wall biosynthesis